MHKKTFIQPIAIACVILGIGGVFVWVIFSIQHAIKAENHFQAVFLTTQAISKYAEKHSGMLPKSWGDIEHIPIDSKTFHDWNTVRGYVIITFSHLHPDNKSFMESIKPRGPCYEYNDLMIMLQDNLRGILREHE